MPKGKRESPTSCFALTHLPFSAGLRRGGDAVALPRFAHSHTHTPTHPLLAVPDPARQRLSAFQFSAFQHFSSAPFSFQPFSLSAFLFSAFQFSAFQHFSSAPFSFQHFSISAFLFSFSPPIT
jgi:hypothetical protein